MGILCEERLGLPLAGHSQFHPAPTNSPQRTDEPLSHDGGMSCGHQAQSRRRGRRCSRCQSRHSFSVPGEDQSGAVISLQIMEGHSGANIHTAAHGKPHDGAVRYFVKDCSLGEEPMLEKGKRVRRKEWQRGTVMD